jgi:sodium-dependent dicarboxylate transporter 2/3/5
MHRRVIYELSRRRWLILALLIGLVLMLLPRPPAMRLSPEKALALLTEDGRRMLVITIVATILFITEPIPLPTVALLIVVAQAVLVEAATPSEVARSLMNDSVLFIMGSLMLAAAMVRQRLEPRIALAMLRLTGPNLSRLMLGIMVVCALIASIVGEHSVAAIMLPVVLLLLDLTGERGKAQPSLAPLLLLSVAFGCAAGSIGTPSGGARNAIILEYWRTIPSPPIHVGYVDWIKYIYPMVLVQTPVIVLLLSRTFRCDHIDLTEGVSRLKQQIAREGRMGGREWLAVALFVLILAGWVGLGQRIGIGIVAVLGASLFLVCGLVEWDDYNRGVNWGVVLLYASAISMGVAMQKTGAAEWIATAALRLFMLLQLSQPLVLLVFFAVVTGALANCMSPGAAAAVTGPVFFAMAATAGVSLAYTGFVIAVGAGFGYLTPMGRPSSLIIHASGYVRSSDFLRIGWKVIVAATLILVLMAWLYWPHLAPPPTGRTVSLPNVVTLSQARTLLEAMPR